MAQYLCAGSDLQESGKAVCFRVMTARGPEPAFAIRWRGQVYAYQNSCAHVPVMMDWQTGDFFDLSRQYLICSMHGAWYAPDTGACLGGPCRGAYLQAVPLTEQADGVYCGWPIEADSIQLP
ncbi:Rieske (2Fe-2S) protein [Leeia sp.]|uniref:Rieske (2Fe-2S) protein n=1 Tax=Leeia sp. TaxID=2884678 RepID=UPI0035ADE39B